MRRVLCLNASNVSFARVDARSIVVKPKNKTSLRFPFCRLSALHIEGDLNLHVNTLKALSKHGIPVLFLDGHGRVVLTCTPPIETSAVPWHVLDALLFDERWQEAFNEWLDNHVRALLSRMADLPIQVRYKWQQFWQTYLCNHQLQDWADEEKQALLRASHDWAVQFVKTQFIHHRMPIADGWSLTLTDLLAFPLGLAALTLTFDHVSKRKIKRYPGLVISSIAEPRLSPFVDRWLKELPNVINEWSECYVQYPMSLDDLLRHPQ